MTSAKIMNGGLDHSGGDGAVPRRQLFENTEAAAATTLRASSEIRNRPEEPMPSLAQELWASTEYIFRSQLTWLLILGPIAIVGDSLGILGAATCFAFSGIALIPCAERYVKKARSLRSRVRRCLYELMPTSRSLLVLTFPTIIVLNQLRSLLYSSLGLKIVLCYRTSRCTH